MTLEHASIVLTARDDIAVILDRVRRALGWPWRGASEDLAIRGRVEDSDQTGTFAWRFGPAGRFRREGEGRSPTTSGSTARTPGSRTSPGACARWCGARATRRGS